MTNDLPPTDHTQWVRWVNKQLMRQGARGSSAVLGTTTDTGEVQRVPVTPSDNVPTGPPEEAPTVQVVGFEDAMTVEVRGNIAQTTLLDYYLDGILVATTTATVLFATKDSAGNAFLPDTPYTWVVIARNDFGSVASAPAIGMLRPGVTSTTVLGWVSAGFALLGALQVGQITLEPPSPDNPGGLRIPLLNGGLIHFPADGSDAVITAVLRARSLITEDHVSMYGETNFLYGGFTAASGVSGPSVQPWVSNSWDHDGAYLTTDVASHAIGTLSGLYDNGSDWITTQSLYDGAVWSIDKTTGASTLLANKLTDPHLLGYQPLGGITKIGTVWFLLAYRNSDSTWWVQRYNSSWTWLSQWEFDFADTGGVTPAIGTDGTSVYIGRMASPTSGSGGRLVIRKFSTGGTLDNTATTNVTSTSWLRESLTGLYVGGADYGSTRRIATSLSKVMVVNGAGVRQSTEEWTLANTETSRGLAWDGTRFHTLSTSGRVYHYSQRRTAFTREVTWTRHNSTFGWETPASPITTWSHPPRQWMRVETDLPGDGGMPNDPDSVRIYLDHHRQADLAPGVTVEVYEVADTSGASDVGLTNTFPPLASPGYFQSGSEDALGRLWHLPGTGIGRLEGVTDPLGAYTSDFIIGVTTQSNLTKTTGYVVRRDENTGQTKVRVVGKFVFTGAISGTGSINFKLPTGLTPSTTYGGSRPPIGIATMVDASTNVTSGICVYTGGGNVSVWYAGSTRIAHNLPFAWGNGCSLSFDLDFYL